MRTRAILLALATAFALVLAAPVSSAAETAGKPLKVHAKLDKSQVKVGEKVKLKGSLEVVAGDHAAGLEPLLVQKLEAGAWVTIADTSCRPNGRYSLSLSFHVAASLSLRVFYPGTTLYASTSSSVLGLVVIG
ncbi:hypothetical protein [Amycolatopsis suaedae]|uniref:Uncharacterized protein n=1 Tax=Amycolatopsis suaedae TaxID=2510978 RepID=A0A4Q7JBU9_9PSEU|nr:hypothetical protein [Amycolatopsis suaedae]RZQ63754.1 hypothetical protein EWH70_11335 [Amycolatopsis suaedae]